MEKYIKNIQDFANENGIIFEQEWKIGFWRECIGLKDWNHYISYNPINDSTYDNIEDLYDERFYDIAPEDSYHKWDYFAVLWRWEGAIKQLSKWVDELRKLNVELVTYNTWATWMQALLSWATGIAFKIKEKWNLT